MPTLSLAYIGDGVYELLARTYISCAGAARSAKMHRLTVALSRAQAQADAAAALLPGLSEEERAVFLRGRNAKPHSQPRHAKGGSYEMATALEALFGWLYLSGQQQRLGEIWEMVKSHFEKAT